MHKKAVVLLFALILCLVVGSAPRAASAAPAKSSGGPYVLDWWTVDGGGGLSTGGVYSLRGTIGQADAVRAACGAYQLAGGFWASPGRAGSCYQNLPLIMRGP
jgi:hypothetical protein